MAAEFLHLLLATPLASGSRRGFLIFSMIIYFLFVLPIAVLRDVPKVEAVVNDEGRALLMFRDALTTDPLRTLANWNINHANPCLWSGVHCDQDLNVDKLILEGRQLEGIISKELSRLTHLRTLSLAGNNITGVVPPELGQLSALHDLNLSNNVLTGDLPVQMDYLDTLRVLDLSHNMLTGPLPVGLLGPNCSKLTYISLAANRFTGSIPDTVGICEALEVINLASNMIGGGIPSSVGRLRAVLYADLGDNLLVGTLPSELGFCLSLVLLNVSRNGLEGDLPVTMSNLRNLQYFDASQNRLSGQIIAQVVFQPNMLHVNLSHNDFSGSLPVFNYGNCTPIAKYDVSFNNLSGDLPQDFGLCTPVPAAADDSTAGKFSIGAGTTPVTAEASILELDLSGNNLTGILQISSSFTNIQTLDVSDNRLSGMLPDTISEWHAVRALDFSNNLFRGMIPSLWTGLKKLVDFNVSGNNLTGPIPQQGAFLPLKVFSFLGNQHLCGSPVAVTCPRATLHLERTKPLRAPVIIVISAAGLVAFLVFLIIMMSINLARRSFRTEYMVCESAAEGSMGSPILGKLVLFGRHRRDYYDDIETGRRRLLANDYAIGSGSTGTVYRACLQGERVIAVKKFFTLGLLRNQEDFEHEMDMLGKLWHPNLVPMHGYYWSSSKQLLVSDYIDNGTLYQHLHQVAPEFHMDWPTRLGVALGTAKALAFLHECRPPILHFNVKSSNILLNGDFNPFLADYGLTKILPLMDVYMAGSEFQSYALGYVAPELACHSFPLTEKCDVYSFGVVLLELTTSQLPVFRQARGPLVLLCDLVRAALEYGRFASCLDAALVRGNPLWVAAEMMTVLKLGLDCTSQQAAKRPTMADVVDKLVAIQAGVIRK